ncbi:MAG: divergent polysaccharide deacetylase family protein [Rhodospirillales bacterium]
MSSRVWTIATVALLLLTLIGLGWLFFVPVDSRPIRAGSDLPPAPEAAPAPLHSAATPSPPANTADAAPPEAAPASPKAAATPAPVTTRPAAVSATGQDTLPWRRYAAPFRPQGKRPMIAIVIDDVGLSGDRTRDVISLRAPVTIAFLSYAEDLPAKSAAARKAGHEVMVHVPMEPMAKEDPGPNALTTDLTAAEIRERLDWALGRFEGFVGFNNHMGSKFTSDRTVMTQVAAIAKQRGLLFLDSVTSARSVAWDVAREQGVPTARRDVFLDNDNAFEPILVQLGRLERVARRDGTAIAIGHPHEATLEALNQWLSDIEKRGFQLAPVSEIVRRRMAAATPGN